MYTIRPYREEDKKNIQDICLVSMGSENSPFETQRYVLIMFCNYYVEQEPENCFVVADENDEAVGYIVCAEDYDRYAEVFNKIYMPQIRALSVRRQVDARLDMLGHGMFKKDYPAHLHINIYPEYRRIGAGSRLVDTLKGHLKSKGIHSLMLVVASDNIRAQRFYRRNKFKELKFTGSGVAMGIRF